MKLRVPSTNAKIVGVVAIVVSAMAVGYFYRTSRVSAVFCVGESGSCPADAQPLLDTLQGKSFFFFDHFSYLEDRLPAQGWQVQSLKKRLPQTLIVELQPLAPVYSFTTNATNNWLVLPSGQFTPVESVPSGIAHFSIASSEIYQEVTHIPQSTHSFLTAVAKKLPSLQIPFSELVVIDPHTLEIVLPNNRRAIIDDSQPVTQLEKLKLVLEQQDLDAWPEPIAIIDMRFRYPVLKTPFSGLQPIIETELENTASASATKSATIEDET